MADIAQLGFSADTSDLRAAKASLEALVPAAQKVDRAADNVAESFDNVNRSAAKVANTVRDEAGALNQAASGATKHAAAVRGIVEANTQAAIAVAAAGSNVKQFDSHVVAYRENLMKSASAIKFTGTEALNFSRQLSDIGVTLAMGMNPFMIALQQGPQLFDIIQMKAATSGATIGTVFRAAGASIYAAIAPLLPVIVGVGAVVGTLAAGFALATREINKGSGDIAAGLGLTEKQMERVKKSGIDTGVTLKDTFLAFIEVTGDRLKGVFGPALDWFSKKWNTILDFITEYGGKAIAYIVGGFVGGYRAIVAVWQRLPGTLGDLVYQVTNAHIAAVEWMINKSIAGINMLIGFANAAAAKVGLPGLSSLGTVSLGQVANPFAGVAAGTRKAAAEGFTQGLADGAKMTDRFFSDVGKAARKRAQTRIVAAAGDPEKNSKNDGVDGKTDGEKFSDIMKAADARIASLQAEKNAIGLTAEAAARLRFEQELLNDADRAGIKLSPEQRAAIAGKADAFAKLTVEMERLKVMQGINEKIDQDRAALEQQRNEIGLSGEALIAYRYEQDLLNQAKAKHIELTELERIAIRDAAIDYAAQSEAIRKQREALDNAKETTRGFFTDLYQNVRGGMSIWDSFANAFTKAIDRIIDKLVSSQIDKLIDQIFNKNGSNGGGVGGFIGSVLGGLFKNANGNAFGSGGITAFANGGAFTNSVVASPTLFKFASGSKFGMMGEAGPEAVMPLKRGSDGSLGVQMHGAKSGATGQPIINVTNQYTLSGAISSQDIVAMNRRAAEQTLEQVKRNLTGWVDSIERDGAIV